MTDGRRITMTESWLDRELREAAEEAQGWRQMMRDMREVKQEQQSPASSYPSVSAAPAPAPSSESAA